MNTKNNDNFTFRLFNTAGVDARFKELEAQGVVRLRTIRDEQDYTMKELFGDFMDVDKTDLDIDQLRQARDDERERIKQDGVFAMLAEVKQNGVWIEVDRLGGAIGEGGKPDECSFFPMMYDLKYMAIRASKIREVV